MLSEVPPCPQCCTRPWSAEFTGVSTPLTGVRTGLYSWARHLFQERRLNFTKNFSSPIDRTQDFPLKLVEMGGYIGCFLNIEPLFYLWDKPNVVILCCPFSASRAPGVGFRGLSLPFLFFSCVLKVLFASLSESERILSLPCPGRVEWIRCFLNILVKITPEGI